MRLIRLLSLALISFLTIYISDAYADPLFGTTGKISGVVTDSKDGSALAGAILSIDGTQIKAGTDDAGQFAILNVPVGTYSVKCTYVGYESQVQKDVKVSADLTTTVNFAMSVSGGLTTDTVTIEVQRRTVPTETSGKIIGTDIIDNQGIRGIENIVAHTSGVVQDEKGQNLNIRGGRNGETNIVVDGVVTNNPLDRKSTAQVSNGALEEIAVLTGGFSAEYGNVLSGVVNVVTKSGGTQYSGSVEAISDFVAGKWNKTTQQGYNVYSVSLGGPVIPTKKMSAFWSLFASYERTFQNVSQPISDDAATQWIPTGILPNFGADGNSWTGKSIFDFGSITKGKVPIKVTAGYLGNINKDRVWIGSMGYYDSYHMPIERKKNHEGFLKINQSIGSKTFYDLQGSYLLSSFESADGILGLNTAIAGMDGYTYPWYIAYGDENVVPGITEGNVSTSAVNFGVFRGPNRVYPIVTKNKIEQMTGNLNVTHQILTKKYGNHEIKFGGEYKQYKIRSFSLQPMGYAVINPTNKDTAGHRIIDPIVDEQSANSNFLASFGYDPLGNESNTDYLVNGLNITEGPMKPRVGAAYLLDKMEFTYFNTNIGLRMDYLDPNTLVPVDYKALLGTNGQINYQKVKKTFVVSPRLGFSFPITDKTVFHAQYGKFVQMPALQNLYTNQRVLRDLADGGVGYFTIFNNPNLKPERTTAYELGIKHTVGEYVTLGLTAYYKETSDLIQAKNIKALDNTYSFAIYDNGDFGVVRGLDFSLDMRRLHRLRASISYSLSYASGTGSDINTLQNVAYNGTEPPKIPSALNYDQRHTGTIELDYRFGGKEDVPKGVWGAILQRLGVNLLFNFNSGRPYTPVDNSTDPLSVVASNLGNRPTGEMNSLYGPWNLELDLKIDKAVTVFKKLNFDIYLLATNLLNSELVNTVFAGSGDAGNTGWLDSYTGQQWANQNGPDAVNLYNIRSHAINNYGPPRQVRLGLRMFF